MPRFWIVGASIFLAVLVAGLGAPTGAQGIATPYPLLMSRDTAKRVIAAWNEERPYVPGEVLVKFRDGVTPAEQGRAMSVMRAPLDSAETTWVGDVLLARTPAEPDAEAAAGVLGRQPEVEWAQPNYVRRLNAAPNDSAYSRQWNFDLIDMPRAWEMNQGATSDVTVAVIDTGITTMAAAYPFSLWTGSQFELVNIPVGINPDIAAARIEPGLDFVFWAGPVIDMVGHGTHVAGTILEETNNSLGLAGIAYQATLLPLKVCFGYWELQIAQSSLGIPGFVDPRDDGGCPDAAIAEAVRYAADQGVNAINLSLGGPFQSPIMLDAITYAVNRGVFVAIAGGNGFEVGNLTQYPAAYAPQVAGVVSLGAVGRSQRRAYYSSTGSYIGLVAPGGDVRDGGLAGVVYQVSLFGLDFDPFTIIRPRFDRYSEVPSQGTSMAAAHATGVAALLHTQGITEPAAIEAALKRFARDLGSPERDDEHGDGLINARDVLFGFGVGGQ